MSEEKRRLLGNGRTGMDYKGQAGSNGPGWWQRKGKALWEKSFWHLAKVCNCANLASEDDSGKTAVEKSGCCKLAKTLT